MSPFIPGAKVPQAVLHQYFLGAIFAIISALVFFSIRVRNASVFVVAGLLFVACIVTMVSHAKNNRVQLCPPFLSAALAGVYIVFVVAMIMGTQHTLQIVAYVVGGSQVAMIWVCFIEAWGMGGNTSRDNADSSSNDNADPGVSK